MDSSVNGQKIAQVTLYLKTLELRISRIEEILKIDSKSSEDNFKFPPLIPNNISARADSLENEIGQFWFAKVGIVILAIGVVLLMTFPYQNLPPVFPSLVGFALVMILIALSHYWRNSLLFLSKYIFGGGLVLLYFTVLRLHFFSNDPAIENYLLFVLLLLIVSALHLYLSYKRKSSYLSAIGITFVAITALISNNSSSIITLLILLSFIIDYLRAKFNWSGFFLYGIIVVYFAHFLWFINNPFLGNKAELQNLSYFTVLALLIYASIFSLGNLFRENKNLEDWAVKASSFINCFMCYSLFLIITVAKYKEVLALSHLIASVIFLVLSVLFWQKEKSKYSTFFYSILGYAALSVAIIAQFPKPDFFVWLCWQSLIVVSTAIWFRSKIIILANFIMYLIIFFSYLIFAGKIGVVALSFGIVALISARILNWQKNRLELKTEAMRLSYLAAAFFIFPYALYHIVPKDYISLSWTIVAVAYYIISIILKNKKYRWMSLLTLLITVVYVLIVGTTSLDPSYRIISFIFLGLVLLIISIFYSKVKSRNIFNK